MKNLHCKHSAFLWHCLPLVSAQHPPQGGTTTNIHCIRDKLNWIPQDNQIFFNYSDSAHFSVDEINLFILYLISILSQDGNVRPSPSLFRVIFLHHRFGGPYFTWILSSWHCYHIWMLISLTTSQNVLDQFHCNNSSREVVSV